MLKKRQTLLLTLDAEKAFDQVLWPYIFELCKGFDFHNTFINWLKAMCQKTKGIS